MLMPEADGSNDKKVSFSAIFKSRNASSFPAEPEPWGLTTGAFHAVTIPSVNESTNLHIHQGHELLAAMHVSIARFPLGQRSGDTELKGERIVALEKAYFLFRAPARAIRRVGSILCAVH
jgi:hypothetical protein